MEDKFRKKDGGKNQSEKAEAKKTKTFQKIKARAKTTKAKTDIKKSPGPDKSGHRNDPKHENRQDKTQPKPSPDTIRHPDQNQDHTDEHKTKPSPAKTEHRKQSNPAKNLNQHNPVLGAEKTLMRLHGVLWGSRRSF